MQGNSIAAEQASPSGALGVNTSCEPVGGAAAGSVECSGPERPNPERGRTGVAFLFPCDTDVDAEAVKISEWKTVRTGRYFMRKASHLIVLLLFSALFNGAHGQAKIQFSQMEACGPTALHTVCITSAPYYASPSGLTITTVSRTFAAGTSGKIASCSTYAPNNGVYIAGAGASGADYIGKVISCIGNTLVVIPATSTKVLSGTVVQHDETAAFQAAINTAGTLGIAIVGPDGWYNIYGQLQDTSGANAVLKLPSVALGSAPSVPISISGLTPPVGYGYDGGMVIQTPCISGNFLGGYISSGPYGGFIAANLFLNKVRFHAASTNPGCVLVDASHTATASMSQTWFDSNARGTPANASGWAFKMPAGGNDVRNSLDQVTIVGFNNGALLGEHTHAGSIWMANIHNCLVMDSRSSQGNAIRIDYAWHQLCDNFIVGGTSKTTISIGLADSEVATTNFLYDPGNTLFGDVWEHNPYNDSRSTSTITTPHVTGGSNLRVHNLDTGACFGATCTQSCSSQFSIPR